MTPIAGILFMSLLLCHGCGTSESIVRKFKTKELYLKKKIMVFPAIDHSGLPSDKAGEVTENLITLLKNSPRLLLCASPANPCPTTGMTLTDFGVAYYTPEILEMAGTRGINALVCIYLPPVEISRGKGGIWPFRYATDTFKINMIVNMTDVTTGCLLLSSLDSEEMTLQSDKIKDMGKSEVLNQVFTKTMPRLLERQASAVIQNLEKRPWTGRILEIRNGTLKISAGRDVGLVPGLMFTVHEHGEAIVCRTGITVDVPGREVGRIRISSVSDSHAMAEPEEGGPFLPGQEIVFIH